MPSETMKTLTSAFDCKVRSWNYSECSVH